MMRCRSILVLALAAASAACRPGVSGNNLSASAATGPSGPEPVATIAVAAAGGADCAAQWNGEAVTQTAITEKSVTALEQAIRAAGGAASLTENSLPIVRVEAAPQLAYACVGTTLKTLQHSGFPSVVLRPAGGGEDAHAEFFLETLPATGTPTGNITIGRGRLTWNGTPTNLGGVRSQIQALASGGEAPPPPGMAAVPPGVVASPPNAFVVTVARDVSFGELHALLRTIEDAGERGTLRSCAGPAGPQGEAIPGC